jgi:hypothetical protein
MPNKIQVKRGLKATMPTPGDAGEFLFATDTNDLYISNGVTNTLVGRQLWVQTSANVIPNNVSAATSLLTGNGGAGIGSLTFPTGFWVEGRTIQVRLNGHEARAVSSTTVVRVNLGGTTINVPVTTASIAVSGTWEINVTIVAYSPTTFWVNGTFVVTNTSNANYQNPITRQVAGTATPTIATVASPTNIDVTIQKTTTAALTFTTTSAHITVLS